MVTWPTSGWPWLLDLHLGDHGDMIYFWVTMVTWPTSGWPWLLDLHLDDHDYFNLLDLHLGDHGYLTYFWVTIVTGATCIFPWVIMSPVIFSIWTWVWWWWISLVIRRIKYLKLLKHQICLLYTTPLAKVMGIYIQIWLLWLKISYLLEKNIL